MTVGCRVWQKISSHSAATCVGLFHQGSDVGVVPVDEGGLVSGLLGDFKLCRGCFRVSKEGECFV